jgi:hypothetical protein
MVDKGYQTIERFLVVAGAVRGVLSRIFYFLSVLVVRGGE